MNLFSNMGSMLKQGVSVLGDSYNYWKTHGLTGGLSTAKDVLFPAPQKTVITPSIVSDQPYTTYQGHRSTSQDAPTVTPWYKKWWNAATTKASEAWEGFTAIKTKAAVAKKVDTITDSLTGAATKVVSALPDYFMQKWGMKPRPSEGENLNNSPVQNLTPVTHYNKTQDTGAATEDAGLFASFLSLFGQSQPKGEYNQAFPQSAPVVVVPNTGVEKAQKGGGLSLSSIGIFALLAFGGFMFLKKGGK